MVNELKDFKVEDGDILASFDVVSLFTKIPVDEALVVVREITNEETEKLARVCLKSTFFSFKLYYMNKLRVLLWDPLFLL